jgi:hypothetical protein
MAAQNIGDDGDGENGDQPGLREHQNHHQRLRVSFPFSTMAAPGIADMTISVMATTDPADNRLHCSLVFRRRPLQQCPRTADTAIRARANNRQRARRPPQRV